MSLCGVISICRMGLGKDKICRKSLAESPLSSGSLPAALCTSFNSKQRLVQLCGTAKAVCHPHDLQDLGLEGPAAIKEPFSKSSKFP